MTSFPVVCQNHSSVDDVDDALLSLLHVHASLPVLADTHAVDVVVRVNKTEDSLTASNLHGRCSAKY